MNCLAGPEVPFRSVIFSPFLSLSKISLLQKTMGGGEGMEGRRGEGKIVVMARRSGK